MKTIVTFVRVEFFWTVVYCNLYFEAFNYIDRCSNLVCYVFVVTFLGAFSYGSVTCNASVRVFGDDVNSSPFSVISTEREKLSPAQVTLFLNATEVYVLIDGDLKGELANFLE